MIQISTSSKDYVIDAWTLHSLIERYLKPVFESNKIVKIFHGCDVDLSILAVFGFLKMINTDFIGKLLDLLQKCI